MTFMPYAVSDNLLTFAQADDANYVPPAEFKTTYEVNKSYNPFNGGSLIFVVVPVLILTIAAMIGLAKIFKKAHKPMWWAFIPVFNLAKMFEMLGKPAWWGLLILGSTIPYAGYGFLAGALVLLCLADIELGARFGKSTGWSLGFLAVLGFVGTNMLGFSKTEYKERVSLGLRHHPGQASFPHPPVNSQIPTSPQSSVQPAPFAPPQATQSPRPIAPAHPAPTSPHPTPSPAPTAPGSSPTLPPPQA